ncbi:MAG: sulfatase [Deltaproteobacteria bacterium]|nr:sulfatase [Deltaproteobacteria bacterium]
MTLLANRRRPQTLRLTAILLALVVGAIFAIVMLRRHDPRRNERPIVVLITIDTLRADALSLEKDGSDKTPFLAQLAQQAVVFRNAYSPSSWTVPAMASLFTSLAPQSHGVIRDLAVRRQPVLSSSFTTLAESLKQAGYVTIGLPSNPHLARELGFAQGFDHYANTKVTSAESVNDVLYAQLRKAFKNPVLDETKAHPFLWIHYMDPHVPYTPHQPWIGECAKRALINEEDLVQVEGSELIGQIQDETAPFTQRLRCTYESEVRFLDDQLRALNERLQLDRDNVLLILTADHGEEFAEHRRFGHANSLYEELLRVPLLIRWPRVLKPSRVDTPVNLLDVYPTLMALLGLPVPTASQGRSLVALMEGSSSAPQTQFFHLTRGHSEWTAIRQNEWKLIHGPGKSTQLFDLQQDPHERTNRVTDRPQVVTLLDTALMQQTAALPAPPPLDNVELPPEAQERLRQLGYGD